MITSSTSSALFPLAGPGLCLLLGALLIGAGCVSQERYEDARAEADAAMRTVEATRTEMEELEQHITTLHALNKKEEALATELRATIEREAEAVSLYRRTAENHLAARHTQLSRLMTQHRELRQELAEVQQDGARLQAVVTRYKTEADRVPLLPPAPPAPPISSVPPEFHAAAVPTPVPAAVTPDAAPPAPVSPKPATASRPAKPVPVHVDESWTGKIRSWVSSVWDWIFG